jgi:hypothetical protein
MTSEPSEDNRPQLEWRDLAAAAERIRRGLFHEVNLEWLERGWLGLMKTGLTDCCTTMNRCRAQIHFLAMFTLYAEAREFALGNEGSSRLEVCWEWLAEELGVDLLCLGQILGPDDQVNLVIRREDGALVVESDERSEEIDEKPSWIGISLALEKLVRTARPQVFDGLLNTLGEGSESRLFANFWASDRGVSEWVRERRERLEDECEDWPPDEIEQACDPARVIEEVLNDAVGGNCEVGDERMPLFRWVTDGCRVELW